MKSYILALGILALCCADHASASQQQGAKEAEEQRAREKEAFMQEQEAEANKDCPTLMGEDLGKIATFGPGLFTKIGSVGVSYSRGILEGRQIGKLALDKGKKYEGAQIDKTDGEFICEYKFNRTLPFWQNFLDNVYATQSDTISLKRMVTQRSDAKVCPDFGLKGFYAALCDPGNEKISVVSPQDYDRETACDNVATELKKIELNEKPNFKDQLSQTVSPTVTEVKQFKHTCEYKWPSKKLWGEYTLKINGTTAIE